MQSIEDVFSYTITVEDHLSDMWSNNLCGFRIVRLKSGHTRISGMAADLSVFYKVLTVLGDMGISVIKIQRKPYRHKKKRA